MSDQETSGSGAPIYRYNPDQERPFEYASGGDNIELISSHIEQHVGPVDMVFHELISDLVHIDVHWVKPSADYPFHTLVTSGMSDRPMHVPEGFEAHRYAELCILLPADWPISEEAFKDENNYWPVRWLKLLSRFPHEYKTWLAWGHTIPNGEAAHPMADNTELGCMLLLPSINLPNDFHELVVNEEQTIRFYCLYPIYKEELDYKLEHGAEGLLDKFEEFDIPNVVDIHRVNTCA
ncbi:suppressor of fused domain protein [Chitinophaga horti]|uniref:Suppressor of fused domain protein n=1 Tax=Chitinophaga horti TaxID=2920382 RepID=A0ABY6J4Y8_9BACT|nr:suppressor of fused domain protein [Chitinophaga horti]UYQ94740.1 suppressor of fused domain protein [Chitinophaga horti]